MFYTKKTCSSQKKELKMKGGGGVFSFLNRSFNWWNEIWVCKGTPIYCKRKFPIVEEQQLLNAGRTIQRENLFHICSRKLSNTINCTWKSALLEVFPALQQLKLCQFFVNIKKWGRGPKMNSNNARGVLANPILMLISLEQFAFSIGLPKLLYFWPVLRCKMYLFQIALKYDKFII